MQLKDSFLLNSALFRFRATIQEHFDKIRWEVGGEVRVIPSGDVLYLYQQDNVCAVESISDHDLINTMVHQGNTFWVLRRAKKSLMDLQACDVTVYIDSMEIQIGVDENMADFLLSKGLIQSSSIKDAVDWLSDEFLMDGVEGSKRSFVAYLEENAGANFQLLGRSWCADISRPKNATPRVITVRKLSGQKPESGVMDGIIEFADISVASKIMDPVSRKALAQVIRDGGIGGYLELWNSYNRIESQMVLQNARTLGKLRYVGFERTGDEYPEWRFIPENHEIYERFSERWDTIDKTDGIELEAAQEAPSWLQTPESADDILDIRERERHFRGRARFEKNAIVIRPNDEYRIQEPPEHGILFSSITGHRVAKDRRARAKRSIDKGIRLPQLRYFLEGAPLPVSEQSRKLPALTPYARQTFSGKPTEMQEKAIHVALNTPDIAIIVGPPGTGKTQVIAALERRLAEIYGVNQNPQHQFLITSFQHDAVENALSRTEVFGLPAIKVGLRRNRGEDCGVDLVDSWCATKKEYVEKELEKLEANEPQVPLLKKINNEISFLRFSSGTAQERTERLNAIDNYISELSLHGLSLPRDLNDEWVSYLRQVKISSAVDGRKIHDKAILRIVRGLRHTPVGFADDGRERAWRCLRALRREGLIDDNYGVVLERAYKHERNPDEEFLNELAELKSRLIDRFTPDYRPPHVKNLIDQFGVDLLNRIDNAYQDAVRTSRKGVAWVLSDYYESLCYEPDRIRQTARYYTSIVGATCQQAAGQSMELLKLIPAEGIENISFDTVIVDESARANPLDLFIPMSMARRRVILVGDHLQLPHLLDPNVESELSKRLDLNDAQKEAMQQSLFKRLVDNLRKLRLNDRIVFLDTQFRMHPLLGDFVSKNFYENENEPSLKSGRSANEFEHSLPGYEGKVFAWIDVPHSEGGEERSNAGSRLRRSEAKRIAKEVRMLMEAAPDLSFGVITFYSAQRDQILKELLPIGVTEQVSDGLGIKSVWREINGQERLRIGTVDAFQGKEFDVVLLSAVRSSIRHSKHNEQEYAWNRRYGFLRLSNRMNVAMSRQRKLLIVVGDSSMAEGADAQAAVPALSEFYKMCKGQNGTIVR